MFGEFIISQLEQYDNQKILMSIYNKGIVTPWLDTFKDTLKQSRRQQKLKDLGI